MKIITSMFINKLNTDHVDILKKYLYPYENTSLFMLSNLNAAGINYQDKIYHGEYFGSFSDQNNINGVLVHYWNGNITMQADSDDIMAKLLEEFRGCINRPVAGVFGEDKQALYIIENLLSPNTKFAVNGQEQLYNIDLTNFTDAKKSDYLHYRIEQARKVDKDTLFQWLKDYQIETLGADDTPQLIEHVNKRIEQVQNQKYSYVLLANNLPVSLCGSNSNLEHVIQIGPVWTPHEHRKKGYAQILITDLLSHAKNNGVKKALLFSDNPVAIRIYEKVGFQHCGYYRLALLKQPVTLSSQA